MSHLDEMRTFVAVTDAQSLTGAAGTLNIALSAVSRRLKELERRLGTTLILRSTRSINLTTAGEDYLWRCRRILDDIQEAESAVSQGAKKLMGRIRMAAPLTFSTQHLGPILLDFMVQHPEVNIDLDLNDRRVDLIGEGFDLTIRIGQLSDSGLIAKRLTTIRRVPCAAPALLAAYGQPEKPEDLAELPILTYRSTRNHLTWPFTRPDGTSGVVKLGSRMAVNNGDMLCMAAEKGLGVVLEPTFITYQAIASGTLVPLFADHEWSDYAAYALFAQNRNIPRRVRSLIDFIAEELSPEPAWDRHISFT
ncbi:LysR family transcriptional regulator [Maritalea myrionectae]|uniref:LysR family transcriptional regulator n=1 Tax=Maritalea myrionectae TaxID=454601 RepID=UPI0004068772|nr:LysR family transcriptional regulator [Maritalea myrionectae]